MHLRQQIFVRVAGLLILMILGISVAYSVYSVQRHREMTKGLWKTRSRVLADEVRHQILWDDRVRLRQVLLNEQQGSDVLLYAFVIRGGEAYVFTFEKGVPEALLQLNGPGADTRIREYQDQDGMVIYDFATPIDEEGTVLRLGLKRSVIDAKMRPLLLSIGLIGLLSTGISLYLAYVLSRRTTREVDTMVEAISSYGELNDEWPSIQASTAEVSELVKSFRGLTARRKKAEEDLSSLNARLEQLVNERTSQLQATNRELDAFAYSVSHDLRAPLRGVEGFSVALLEDYDDRLDETGRDYLNRIRQGCIRMGRLIDDLLKLSRITRSELEPGSVNLGEMAAEVVDELRRHEPERRVTVRIGEGLVSVADPTLIRTVLENLLGNAWKFTARSPDATIEFGVLRGEGDPVFFVRDNGAGFNMEYENRLFGAFQRLHRADEFEGTGIGLASAQRVMLLHGGRIWAVGEEGKGAVFYFTFGDNAL